MLDFIQRVENLSLPEAIARLDGSPGPSAQGRCSSSGSAATSGVRRAASQGTPTLLTAAARFYAGRLRRHSEGREYLASRGVGQPAAARLGLGYAPGSGLRESLESDGFDCRPAPGTTGCSWSGEPSGAPEWWSFPDAPGGLVRWLVGRAADPDRTPRFQASARPQAGAWDWGVSALRRPWTVVAEGVFDWLALGRMGPSGRSLPWAPRAWSGSPAALRGCPRVFLAFDNDDAGREATGQLQTLLERRAAAVALPEGVGDVAELAALSQGRAAFLRLLTQAARSAR